jgi:phosphatidylinositol alpha-1,6-mannosyltransferase
MYGWILLWSLRHLRRARYQALVAGGETFCNGLLFVLGRLFGVPVIGLGNAEEFTVVLMGKGAKNAFKRWWIRATHKRAAGHVVVCHFCRDILVSVGVAPDRIDVNPSSINQNKLHPADPDRTRAHRVLSVGRMIERKGFHLLVDAVAKLRRELPDVELTIVGDGPYRPLVEEKIREFAAAGFVTLKGRASDEELSQLYRTADVFVLAHMMLPSGDTEGCPTVFSEASGSGLPVIGGTGGGAATAIVEGETGYIVDSRNVDSLVDRLRTILTNPSFARQMGEAGIAKVRRDHDPQKSGMAFHRSITRFSAGGDTPVDMGDWLPRATE